MGITHQDIDVGVDAVADADLDGDADVDEDDGIDADVGVDVAIGNGLCVVIDLILKKGITPLTAIGKVCQYPLVVNDADFIDNPTLADGGKQRVAIGCIVLFEQIRL